MEVEVVTPEDYMGEVIGDLVVAARQALARWTVVATHESSSRARSPVRDVRIRHGLAVEDPGSGDIHNAIPFV